MTVDRLVRDVNRKKLMMPSFSNLVAKRLEANSLAAGTVHILDRVVPVTTV